MTFPGTTRIVRHRHFGNGEAVELDQRREKTMRAVEKFYSRNAFALEDAVGAAGVGDVFAGQFVADPIRDPRRSDSEPTVTLAPRFDTRAANAVEIAQRFHHR